MAGNAHEDDNEDDNEYENERAEEDNERKRTRVKMRTTLGLIMNISMVPQAPGLQRLRIRDGTDEPHDVRVSHAADGAQFHAERAEA